MKGLRRLGTVQKEYLSNSIECFSASSVSLIVTNLIPTNTRENVCTNYILFICDCICKGFCEICKTHRKISFNKIPVSLGIFKYSWCMTKSNKNPRKIKIEIFYSNLSCKYLCFLTMENNLTQ